jgi:hypothetical protein
VENLIQFRYRAVVDTLRSISMFIYDNISGESICEGVPILGMKPPTGFDWPSFPGTII